MANRLTDQTTARSQHDLTHYGLCTNTARQETRQDTKKRYKDKTPMTNHMTDNTTARSRHDLIHKTLCMDMHRSTLVYIYIYIYIKEATPHPPGLGSRIGSLGRCLLESCWGLLGSKLGVVEI